MKRKPAVLLLAVLTAAGMGLAVRTEPVDRGLSDAPFGFAEEEVILPDGGVPLSDAPEEDYRNEILELVNAARAEEGLSPLVLDGELNGAAQVRASECLESFSHTRPGGSAYKTAIEEAGISSDWTGENLATGQTAPRQVVESWLKSEGHRANILNEHYTRLGLGREANRSGRYRGYTWVQLFSA